MTHPTWELPLSDCAGALILMPCPGTSCDLQSSLDQLQSQGVHAIVTALTLREMQERNITQLPQAVHEMGMAWYHTPIEDDQIPNARFLKTWQQISNDLHHYLSEGNKVALHCMGGSGRTGLLAAHVLLERRWTLADIISQVQQRRPNTFTKPEQLEYVKNLAQNTPNFS